MKTTMNLTVEQINNEINEKFNFEHENFFKSLSYLDNKITDICNNKKYFSSLDEIKNIRLEKENLVDEFKSEIKKYINKNFGFNNVLELISDFNTESYYKNYDVEILDERSIYITYNSNYRIKK